MRINAILMKPEMIVVQSAVYRWAEVGELPLTFKEPPSKVTTIEHTAQVHIMVDHGVGLRMGVIFQHPLVEDCWVNMERRMAYLESELSRLRKPFTIRERWKIWWLGRR
jgi:hypothetical protein